MGLKIESEIFLISSGEDRFTLFCAPPLLWRHAMCFILKSAVTNVNSIFPFPGKIIIGHTDWAHTMPQAHESLKKQVGICIWVSPVKIQWAPPETLRNCFLLSLIGVCECPSGSPGQMQTRSILLLHHHKCLQLFRFLHITLSLRKFFLWYLARRHPSGPLQSLPWFSIPLFGRCSVSVSKVCAF